MIVNLFRILGILMLWAVLDALGMTHAVLIVFAVAAACIALNLILKSMVDTDDPDFIQRSRWPNRDR